ncbi:MAG: hypothetical protein AAF958_00180 [Planctomycetota bacterium]
MLATPDGPRMLHGHERTLVRGILGIMIDHLHDELRPSGESNGGSESIRYGIDHFDRWDADQRVLLVRGIAVAMLTPAEVPERTAIFEATLDAMAAELAELIELECRDPKLRPRGKSWRRSLTEVVGMPTDLDLDAEKETDGDHWVRQVSMWRDRLCGPHHYLDAEGYRDGSPAAMQRFLRQRGLPPEYLNTAPPVPTVNQVQAAIDQVQRLVFIDEI